MTTPWVKHVEAVMAHHLDKIAMEFKDTALCTCIVRHRGDDVGKMDMMVTADELPQLLAVILRRMTKEEMDAVVERALKAAHPESHPTGWYEVDFAHRSAMRSALEGLMKP